MNIPLVNVNRLHEQWRDPIDQAIDNVITRGDFVLGEEVSAFERAFAAYCGVDHCVGVASGLDALTLTLCGLGIGRGDEVITTANTFIATALGIQRAGATPVLIDHDPETYNMDPKRIHAAITSRTRAIIPVHLYGQSADMEAIRTVAGEHGLMVVEDAAQAHGATYKGQRCGSMGRAAAFSFYPGKNLGAMGDGGAIVTNDSDLAERLRMMRHYGSREKYKHERTGFNSRLDSIQAAILRVKLEHLDEWNATRRRLAARYRVLLADIDVIVPEECADREHVYHIFAIRTQERDEVLNRLNQAGIGAGVHYPIPIHRQVSMAGACRVSGLLTHTERYCSELLSLPMCPTLTDAEQDQVTRELRRCVRTCVRPRFGSDVGATGGLSASVENR